MDEKKIAIVGTGVAGLTTAYFLSKKGYIVDLFDRHTNVAEECSYANGGQISVCNAEVWNTWDNIINGVSWLFNKQAPLALRPDVLGWDKIKWLGNFFGATLLNRYEKNTRKTIDYCLRSKELLLELEDEINIKYDQFKCGIVHIYRNGASYKKALETCLRFQDTGWDVKECSIDELSDIKTNNIVGATISPDDFVGDINVFCRELFYHLQTVYGVEKWKCHVTRKQTKEPANMGLDTLQRDYDEVVVAAGAYTSKLVSGTKIYPIKGYSITVRDSVNVAPELSILDDELKIVSSSFQNKFRVAGTAELAGYDHKVREDRIKPLLNWVKNTTYLKPEQYTTWACLRPMTPDMLPIVKKEGNIWVNSGAGHLGWTIGMALAEQISKEI